MTKYHTNDTSGWWWMSGALIGLGLGAGISCFVISLTSAPSLITLVPASISAVVAIAACVVAYRSSRTSVRSLEVAQRSVASKVVVDLFAEHRSLPLREARGFLYHRLDGYNPNQGLRQLPSDDRAAVESLAFFYDNLGLLVKLGYVDPEPVIGYLGGSARWAWERLAPYIDTERSFRSKHPDPGRWQMYFEEFANQVPSSPSIDATHTALGHAKTGDRVQHGDEIVPEDDA